MTKRKTLSILSLAAVGAASLCAVSLASAGEGGLAFADESGDTRSFVLSASLIGEAKSNFETEVYAGGLPFAFSGASCSGGKATFKGGRLYNASLAGTKANSQGRIGTGFKKLVFEGLENAGGFTVSFMADEATALETKTLEAGSETSEVALSGSGNARKVLLTFDSPSGVSFSSITFHYTCGDAN